MWDCIVMSKKMLLFECNLLYCMTTILNKRFIFSLIRRSPAPWDVADLFYTQCCKHCSKYVFIGGAVQYTVYNNYSLELIFTVHDFNIACGSIEH